MDTQTQERIAEVERMPTAIQHAPTALPTSVRTPADILIYAMEKGGNIEQIEKLMDLQMRWEADQARKAYVVDMAEFKKNPPQIAKDKKVGYENNDGSFTGYKHASLGNVTGAIVEGLAKHGFSHRWDTEQQQGGLIVVTCVLTHRLGHSERTALSSSPDQSGKKNNIQAVGSTITYLQRYTLLAATGLATHDQDDDGAGSGEAASDVSLADKWTGKANAAPSLTDLNKVWNLGVVEIEKADDRDAYDKFKAACNTRKAELEATAAPRNASSRVNNIVRGAGQSSPPPAE